MRWRVGCSAWGASPVLCPAVRGQRRSFSPATTPARASPALKEKRFEQLRRRGFKLPTLDQLEAGRPEALEACAALSAQFAAAREESGDDSAGGFVSFYPPPQRRPQPRAPAGARWGASRAQRTAGAQGRS